MRTGLKIPLYEFEGLFAPEYIYPCNINHELNDEKNMLWKSATLTKIFSLSFSGPWWEFNTKEFKKKFDILPKYFDAQGTQQWPFLEDMDQNKDLAKNLEKVPMIQQVNKKILSQIKDLKTVDRSEI